MSPFNGLAVSLNEGVTPREEILVRVLYGGEEISIVFSTDKNKISRLKKQDGVLPREGKIHMSSRHRVLFSL